MFFRYVYIYLNRLINHEYFNRFRSICSFDFVFSKDFSISTLSPLNVFKLSFFPIHDHEDYNILNTNTLYLLNFRKKFLSFFNLRPSNNYEYAYKTLMCDSFLKNLYDFIDECGVDFTNVNKLFKTKNNYLSLYYLLFFFKKNFSGFFSILFFKEFGEFNLIKFYFILFRIFYKDNILKKSKLFFLDLRKHSNWLLFSSNYRYNLLDFYIYKPNSEQDFIDLLPNKGTLHIIIKNKGGYLEFYRSIVFNFFDRRMITLMRFVRFVRLNLNKFSFVKLNADFSVLVKSYFPTKFSESSTNKFINLSKLDNYLFFFLRRNKIFNKGRYSRNRQTYRTGFYWCLWLNIFVVYGLHFVFYRFIFSFGYLWAFLFVLFVSFIFSRALKYNFMSAKYIVSEFKSFIEIVYSFLSYFYSKCERRAVLYVIRSISKVDFDLASTIYYDYFLSVPKINDIELRTDLNSLDTNSNQFSEIEIWCGEKFEDVRHEFLKKKIYLDIRSAFKNDI